MGFDSVFAVNSTLNYTANLTVSLIALAVNVFAIAYIAYRAKKLGVNPYKHEVFVGTRDYEQARARIDEAELAA
jgi:small basic protein